MKNYKLQIKNLKSAIILLCLFAIVWLLPEEQEAIYDMATGNIAAGFSILRPWWHTAIVPFIDVPNYFLKLGDYRAQIIAWIVWLELAILCVAILKKRSLAITFISLFKGFLIFMLIALYVLFGRYPGNKLIKNNPDDVSIDFHSHTFYSWDGIASFHRSIAFHRSNGYDAYAITEHTILFSDFEKLKIPQKGPFVFLGTEIYDAQGTHHLLYNLPAHIDVLKLNRHFPRIKEFVQIQGGTLASTCWWISESIDAVIAKKPAALEIVNMGHQDISRKSQKNAIRKARENNIPIIGVTDWHGWGFQSYVWSIAAIPGWFGLDNPAKKETILAALKGDYPLRVLQYYRPNEKRDRIRSILDPFFAIYYYLSSINFIKLISWVIWIGLIIILYTKLKYVFWFGYSGVCFWMAGFSFFTWIPMYSINSSLRDLTAIFFGVGVLTLIVAIIDHQKKTADIIS